MVFLVLVRFACQRPVGTAAFWDRTHIHGLCRRAVGASIPEVMVYRAKAVDDPAGGRRAGP
jgi:hypothetical protein